MYAGRNQILENVASTISNLQMPYELDPILETTPGEPPTYSVGMAETYSWVPIQNNAGRPLFARASYITNMSDMSINIESADINIGSISIKDSSSNVGARVVDLGDGGSLRVITQDLESSADSVAIGDVSGNIATVNSVSKALRVEQSTFYKDLQSITNFSGWVASDNSFPVFSIKKLTGSGYINLVNCEIVSHDGNGIFGYEWWSGDMSIVSGPTPSWSNNSLFSYRVFQDLDGSNAGVVLNTATGTKRHSGFITTQSKNVTIPFPRESTANAVWTLFIKRLDSNSEQKVHYTITIDQVV